MAAWNRQHQAFTLVELLLALIIGFSLVGVIAEALLLESGSARQLGRFFRERLVAQRALELIRSEILQSQQIRFALSATEHPDCGLSGRQVVLHMKVAEGKITYSLDAKPAAIWRGVVLMRCGPTYGLDGTLRTGSNESRVLLDGLRAGGFRAMSAGELLSIQIVRSFGSLDTHSMPDEMKQDLSVPMPPHAGF